MSDIKRVDTYGIDDIDGVDYEVTRYRGYRLRGCKEWSATEIRSEEEC